MMFTAHTPRHTSIPLNQNDTADQRLLVDWCVEHDKCEVTKVDKVTKGEQITKVDKMIKV